jgi:hypothetical protein
MDVNYHLIPILGRRSGGALRRPAKTLLPFVEQADILFTDLADTIILLGRERGG